MLFNYAEEVYRSAGYGVNDILFNIVITGAINLRLHLAGDASSSTASGAAFSCCWAAPALACPTC